MTTRRFFRRGFRLPSTPALILLGCSLLLGCAHDSTGMQGSASQVHRGPRLDLGLRISDGRWLELAGLRGTPVLVFVFATFDAVSQASLKSLRPFVSLHPEVAVVGVAAQPRAAQLVDAWAYALDPPFVVGTDPYGRVENGQSTLGKIETVPTFILYGADGYEVDRMTGMVSEADLARFVEPVSDDTN